MTHEEFEKAVLTKLLAGAHPDFHIFRQQLNLASVSKRDWTGTGVYVHFSLPRGCPLAARKATVLDDVRLILSGDIPAGAILHIKDRKIEVLECLRDDGGEWPREPQIQVLDYQGSEQRDPEYLAKAIGVVPRFKMEIGKIYNVVFSTGRYEIEYENDVRCIKMTPESYRVERTDGTTRLVGKDSIFELKEVERQPPPN